MRSLLFFLVFFSFFGKQTFAQDYFSGDFKEEDIQSTTEEKQAESVVPAQAEVKSVSPTAPAPVLQTPVEEQGKVDFFMNDIKASSTSSSLPEEAKTMMDDSIYVEYIPEKVEETLGGIVFCSYGLKVTNLTSKEIKRIRMRFFWEGYDNHKRVLGLNKIPSGKTGQMYYQVPGKKLCYVLFSSSPKVKVESCLIEGLSEVQCAKKIKIKK